MTSFQGSACSKRLSISDLLAKYFRHFVDMGHSPENWSKWCHRVYTQSKCDCMLLFGNEPLTSLVDINIRHKLTG